MQMFSMRILFGKETKIRSETSKRKDVKSLKPFASFKNWGAILRHSHNSHQILHQCRIILICKASNAKPWDHANEVDGDVATPQILAGF